jgi:hypothetical protein
MKHLWLEQGTEYVLFRDILASEKNFNGTVVSAQFSIRHDYLGYKLTVNIGGRLDRRVFERRVDTTGLTFINVFAGLQ